MPTLEECRAAVLGALTDGHPNPEGYMEWFESQSEKEQIKIGCAVLFGVAPEQLQQDKMHMAKKSPWWKRIFGR